MTDGRLATVGTALLVGAVALRLLGAVGLPDTWVTIPILAAFPTLVAVTLAAALVAASLAVRGSRRARSSAVLLALAGLGGALVLVPRATTAAQPPGRGPALTVAVVNVLEGSADAAAVVATAAALGVDLLAVVETTEAYDVQLEEAGIARTLPDVAPGRVAAVHAIGDVRPRAPRVVAGDWPDIAWRLPGGVDVAVVTVHPRSPVGPGRSARWREVLATVTPPPTAPALLLGDLNATADHAAFRTLLAAGWRDAASEVGRGLTPTFRAGGVLPMTLDHVLVGPGVAVDDVTVVSVAGTDHRMVVAAVRLPEPWTPEP